jgi:phenylacetate-CoA ligase
MAMPDKDDGNLIRSAMPGQEAATLLAYLNQLEQTQWWPAEDLEREQIRLLGHSLRHAHENVPFHRQRLKAAGYDPGLSLTREVFLALPLMTRSDIQAQGEALLIRSVPAEHGRVTVGETSGSTGTPIHYYGTELTQFLWSVSTLRDHAWHRRDLTAKLASIRRYLKDAVQPSWGPPADLVSQTGPCATLDIATELDAQLEWLGRHAPAYFITNVSNLYWLGRRSLERGISLPGLREARSFGGTLPDDAREIIRRAWGVPVVDSYTAEEVGYIALQCPKHEHYHVQSENLVVEILGDDGRACRAGEIGRVVLTTLHNFAMPLIRYDIGDYAEAGAPCPCGRGLPVIRRILGRQRNILTLPDGKRRWPSFPSSYWSHLATIRQLQLVQRSPERVDVNVVAERALTDREKKDLVAALQGCLGHPFAMEVRELVEIPRSAGYKFEDFLSEIV